MVLNDGAPLPAAFRNFRPGLKVPWSGRRHWAAPAPAFGRPPPELERLGQSRRPLGRLVRFRLHLAGADALLLRAEPEARLIAARAGGSIIRFGKGKPNDPFYLRCAGRSCDGLVVDLLVGNVTPTRVELIGFLYALPLAARPLLAARPREAAPHYTPDASISIRKLKL
jgi:hypothetical protein